MKPIALPRVPKWSLVTLGVAVLLLVIIRIVLDPIAAHYTRRQLESGEGFRGTFSRVHVTILPPAFRIERLKIIEWPNGKWDNPLYYFENARASILWREILRGHLVGDVELERPKLLLISHHEEHQGKKAATISEQLEAMSPIRIDRLEVKHGELLIARGRGGKAPELWIHDANLVAENMATRKALMEGEYSTLRGNAWVQRTGKLSLAMNMDPWAKGLTFSGKASLRDLDLRELWAFTSDKTDLAASEGRVDLFADLRARDGALSGGVKPVLRNLEVKSASKDLGHRVKALLADAAIHLVSNDDDGERRVATVIPLKGKVSDVHAQMVPTILGAVRNAFVEGLAGGFAELPPQTAEKKEGVVKQTWKALKKGEGPPEAQPEPRQGRKAPRQSKTQDATQP
ncbi:MAG TPA: DUF748 domain-containing protein [Polyangia bacterium]|nr:DUF748 domain-containing protein [Polyangia bacterium]